jgi:tetratricopeptide (TPR) repeat protein/DNA-binding XRE family transcriptional regulator
MNSIGDRLREARLSRGLTQSELARGLATKGFISQVERNRASPSLVKLRVMAERLGMPVSHFTGEKPLELITYLRKSAALAVKAQEAERALSLVDEGLDLPGTANERADLHRIKGTALDSLGRLPESLAAHQTAAATAPPDDPELNASIYTEIGTVLQQLEQFNGAIEANLRANHWIEQSRHADPSMRARILSNLGRSSYALGQLAKADTYFQQALAAATDAESLTRLANAHMNLGVSARTLGDFDRAIEHCNRALELHGRLGQIRTANRVLNNLGDVYYSAGRVQEARRVQRECFDRAQEMGDDLEIGIAGSALAGYLLRDGDLKGSLRLARTSQEAAARCGDHLHQAYAAAIEGQGAESEGRRSVADRKFREALLMLSERQAAGKLAEVCAMYADLLRKRGDVNRAFAFMRIAADRDFASLARLIRKTTR